MTSVSLDLKTAKLNFTLPDQMQSRLLNPVSFPPAPADSLCTEKATRRRCIMSRILDIRG